VGYDENMQRAEEEHYQDAACELCRCELSAERDRLATENAALRAANEIRVTEVQVTARVAWENKELLRKVDNCYCQMAHLRAERDALKADRDAKAADRDRLAAALADMTAERDALRERAEIAETRLATAGRELPALLLRLAECTEDLAQWAETSARHGMRQDSLDARAWAGRLAQLEAKQ